ncbi:DUF4870 domain-containing protein [Agromyces sp. LHK192]|uniref:DUF4870 domain-containing protein n=1 Tax=Agromyces sp. LHK192 TaxID=2498704 RepID=UPI001F0C2243|nr:DUF4870 domain-containing protein [Agromyces sp. LHK192]
MSDQSAPDPNAAPQAPAPAPAAPLSPEQDIQWASFAHLGGILGFLPSLIIWLVFKDRGAFTNVEAKEALNFQITATIAYVAIALLNTILTAITFGIWGFIGWILPLALWAVVIVFSIQGFLKAKEGQHYRYPFAIRLIK